MSAVENKSLYEAIKALEVVPESRLDKLYKQAGEGELAELLVSSDTLSDKNVGMVVAELAGLPYANLREQGVSQEILTIIPYEVARAQSAIVFARNESGIKLAINDTEVNRLCEYVQKKTGEQVKQYYATTREIEELLNRYESVGESKFQELTKGGKITELTQAILEHAEENKASDVHIEPGEAESLVRLRIDGIMHDILRMPSELHEKLVTRIKVMAKLRTDEHQAAQDGKLVIKAGAEDLDIRVSVVPVTGGEKVVMRLLSARARQFALPELGMKGEALKRVEEAYTASHGMILSTGPTGSGKTTSLYAILKSLNQREVNIMTIEDPVEYDLEGVNQIQVNERTELTFAKGLRSIVRQDPDIILVGEIRDEETAGIATNSAMTGHLVLSTLHTNTAATTLPRLIDMGVEPFLVASTVNVIVGQRLVRKICSSCRVSQELVKKELADKLGAKALTSLFGKDETVRGYVGKGCPACHNSGYRDRVGIFEVLVVSEKIREMIMTSKDAGEIEKQAIAEGMVTMLEDGISKVKEGLTTVEEVLRVSKE